MDNDLDDTIRLVVNLTATDAEGKTSTQVSSIDIGGVGGALLKTITTQARKAPPRVPTLYGIDFKITPSGEAKLIEVNGANSGTSGFETIYGDNRVKETIIERMRRIAGDKKLLVSGSYAQLRKERFAKQNGKTEPDAQRTGKKTPLYKLLWQWYAYGRERQIIDHLLKSPSARTILSSEAEREQQDYELLWNGHYRDDQRFDEDYLSHALFLKSADELRLKYCDAYDNSSWWRIKTMITPLLDSKGEYVADSIDGDDIGLLWDRWKFYFGLMNPGFPVVNSAHHERICANKLYQYYMLSNTNVASALIPILALGLGIETRDQYNTFMQKHRDEIFVLKPASGSRGYGVRMVPRRIIESEEDLIGKPISRLVSIEEAWATLPYCLDFLMEGIEILSPYIPSKEIRLKETAKIHDACMRAIVFNGEFIDAYWRLAPKPLDAACPLEERLRANLTRGAIAQAATDEELGIAKTFSESVAHALDSAIQDYSMTSYRRMEMLLWREILGAKFGLEDPTGKEILKAAKKKRSELGMYPLTVTQLHLAKHTVIAAACCTSAIANWIMR